MRKHRGWFMGFGIGLIVGAVMLQMILFAQDQAVLVTEEPPITTDRLSDEAKKAGMLLITQDQLDERIRDAIADQERSRLIETGEEGDSAQPDPSDEPLEEKSAASPEPSKAGQEETKPPAETEQGRVSLHVGYGMTLTEVGEELQKLGVIDDVKEFIEETRPVAKKMKVGTAVFTGKPSYQEIMNELVRKK